MGNDDIGREYGEAILAAISALGEGRPVPQGNILRFCLALQQSLLPLLEKPETQGQAALLTAQLAVRAHEALSRKDEAERAGDEAIAQSIARLLPKSGPPAV